MITLTQGGAARLAPLRCALGWCVTAPSGRKFSTKGSPSGTLPRTRPEGTLARNMSVYPPLQFAALPAGARRLGYSRFRGLPPWLPTWAALEPKHTTLAMDRQAAQGLCQSSQAAHIG